MTEEKHMTRDIIEVLMATKAGEPVSVEYKELVDKINELYGRNAHKAYETYHVSFENNKTIGGWALLFTGEREEDNQERVEREAKEAATKKRVQEAELKEYLRLHKIYGKKDA